MKYEDKADYGDSQDILCVCSWGYGGVCMGMLSLHIQGRCRMDLRYDWDHDKLQGVDADIEISLKEYGFAWIDQDDEVLFYYGIQMNDSEYNRFDFCSFNKVTDIKQEFDWADFDDVSEYIGEDIMNLSFVQQVEVLNRYYGYENVFGSSCWEGLTYEDIFKQGGGKP